MEYEGEAMHCWLPDPYKDETLYSMLARMQIFEGVDSPRDLTQMCFGLRTIIAVADLPCHVDRLIQCLPESYRLSSDNLIQNHTLYPYYTAFSTHERRQELLQYMKGDSGGGVHMKAGVMASSIKANAHFRYCPRCAKEELKNHGELHWHRLHQTPGVEVCSIHNVFLEESTVPVKGYHRERFVAAEPENCPDIDSFTENRNADRLRLTIDIEQLYQLDPPVERVIFIKNARSFLQSNGWIAGSRTLKLTQITSFLDDRISDFLIDSHFAKADKATVIHRLIEILRNSDRVTHPLYYLLLIRAFWGSVESYLDFSSHSKPLYPCFNAASNHFGQPAIHKVELMRGKHGKAFWHYSCDCGFTYSSPELSQNPKPIRVINYGPLWEGKLLELQGFQISIREIGRIMKVDSKTIKVHLSHSNTTTSKPKNHNTLLSENRRKWLVEIAECPGSGVNAIRAKAGALYASLYRNDREWLRQNLPAKANLGGEIQRVNWEQRDLEIKEKIMDAIQSLLCSKQKPLKITQSRVGKLSGYSAILEQHLGKLPQCAELLKEACENPREYQMRKAKWAVWQLIQEKKPLVLWRVLRRMTVRGTPGPTVLNEIRDLISEEVKRKRQQGDFEGN